MLLSFVLHCYKIENSGLCPLFINKWWDFMLVFLDVQALKRNILFCPAANVLAC